MIIGYFDTVGTGKKWLNSRGSLTVLNCNLKSKNTVRISGLSQYMMATVAAVALDQRGNLSQSLPPSLAPDVAAAAAAEF